MRRRLQRSPCACSSWTTRPRRWRSSPGCSARTRGSAAIRTATSGAEALRALDAEPVDVIFCDIKMPGLDGLDLARVLARFSQRPAGRLRHRLRPARDRRLRPARHRLRDEAGAAGAARRGGPAGRRGRSARPPTRRRRPEDETIAVELGGVTRFVQRSQVRYVEAHGDYARLHTATSSHLVRIPLTTLEERWATAGFVRIHRSTLVALPHVDEIRVDGGRCAVRLGDRVLQVSRRHTKELRDRLVRAASLTRETR